MKTLVSSLLLLLLSTSAFAQHGWVKLNIGTPKGVSPLYLWNKDTVWGLAGRLILRTTNGGATWDSNAASILSGPNGFVDMQFTSRDTGFLLPYDGSNIYKTMDGGNTWSPKATGIAASGFGLLQVRFATADSGWVLGASGISRTTDGGETWNNQLPQFAVECCAFTDSKHGVIMGNPINLPPDGFSAALAVTSDGGVHWTTMYSGVPRAVSYVTGVSKGKLAAVGEALVAISTNAGLTWDTVKNLPGSKEGEGYLGASFPDSLHGSVVGTEGWIIHTTDGGATWVRQESGVSSLLYSVTFADSLIGYAAGFDGILKTTNGGQSWVQETPLVFLRSMSFPQPSNQGTTLAYTLPETQHLSLTLFGITGSVLREIFNDTLQPAGTQSIPIDTHALPSGNYTYVLRSEKYFATGTITVVH